VSPRERSAGRKPRELARHLAKLGEEARTARASELSEAGPESNAPEGGVVVESTRTSPGAGGVAVVAEPAEIAGHTDDDARIVVDEEGKAEIVEPPALERRRADRDGDGSLTDEANVADPRRDADAAERKAVEANADPATAPDSGQVAGKAPAPRKAAPGP
jgi:hypothetical protein